MNRKGNIPAESLTILLILFIMVVGGIFAAQVFDEVNTDIQADDSMSNESKTTAGDLQGRFSATMDNAILFAFVLLVIFVIVSVFLLDTHPIFFIITVIALIMFFLVGMILANSFDDMMNEDEIAPYANEFTFTNWLFSHLVEVLIAVGFIIGTAMYVKLR